MSRDTFTLDELADLRALLEELARSHASGSGRKRAIEAWERRTRSTPGSAGPLHTMAMRVREVWLERVRT